MFNMTKKRILITGWNGKIGTLLRETIEGLNLSWTQVLPEQNIRFPDGVSKLPLDADYIFHLAAIANPAKANENPVHCLRTNVITISELIKHYQKKNVHLVIASSIRTSSIGSAYSWSKIAAEAIAVGNSYNAMTKMKLSVVRIGNVIRGSNALNELQKLKSEKEGGRVRHSIEYFQPSYSLLNLFQVAMQFPGCIITPLLFSIPISFVAGFFAGIAHNENLNKILSWQPLFEYESIQACDLLPPWWLKFTMVHEEKLEKIKKNNYIRNRESSKIPFAFLITDFKKRSNNEAKLEEKIRKQTKPDFGKFISYIVEEGILERNRS